MFYTIFLNDKWFQIKTCRCSRCSCLILKKIKRVGLIFLFFINSIEYFLVIHPFGKIENMTTDYLRIEQINIYMNKNSFQVRLLIP